MLLPLALVTLLSSSFALAAYRTVQVGVDDKGNSALVYTPSELAAEVGDVVRFVFRPLNHTLTQSSFENPCVALKDGQGKPLYTTGFVPVDPQKSLLWSQETFRDFEVKNKDPAVFYCQQKVSKSHCGAGMVFVLNPSGDHNQYQAAELAKQQNGTATATATQSLAPGAMPSQVVHNVEVGPNGEFIYDPPSVMANKGDIVRYWFNPKNHTVTEGSIENPCRKKPDGINSGFKPVALNAQGPRVSFDVEVQDSTTPRVLYCAQGLGSMQSHCERLGPMVHLINPAKDGSGSVDGVKASALATVLGAPPVNGVNGGNKVIPVQVGPNGKFVFEPASIKANRGDTIVFSFNPKNHSVTESLNALNPCRRKLDGFNSGFRPVLPGAAPPDSFNLTVGDPSVPQYAYCAQALGSDNSHCERLGPMVFSVNAPDSGPGSFEELKKTALATVLGSAPVGQSSGTNIAIIGGGAAAALASLGGVAFFFIRRRALKRGKYATIDETTAPLGDRSELGEFSIPMRQSPHMSARAPLGDEAGRGSSSGDRPLLDSHSSA